MIVSSSKINRFKQNLKYLIVNSKMKLLKSKFINYVKVK